MNNFYLFLLFYILPFTYLTAQDNGKWPETQNIEGRHLEPVSSYFDLYNFEIIYYQKIRELLTRVDSNFVLKLRFLIIPSFTPEYVIQLEYNRTTRNYRLLMRQPEKSIWYSRYDSIDYQKINIKEQSAIIDSVSANKLIMLYKTAIMDARFKEKKYMILDGTSIYFTVVSFSSTMTAKTTSPPVNTPVGELIKLSETLGNMLGKGKTHIHFSKDFNRRIDALIRRFRKND